MGRNGIRKLDLVSSRGSEPLVENIRATARTSRTDGPIILFRIGVTLHSSPIRKIGKSESICGLHPEALKLQLAGFRLDDVERNQWSLTGTGAGLTHPIPGDLAA